MIISFRSAVGFLWQKPIMESNCFLNPNQLLQKRFRQIEAQHGGCQMENISSLMFNTETGQISNLRMK